MGLYFLLVALILLLSDKGQIAGDGIKRWEALDTLMSKGELTADKYSIVQPLCAVPLYTVGVLHAKVAGAVDEERIHLVGRTVQRFNKIIAFFVVLWLFLILRTTAGWDYRAASIAGLFLLFGTILIPHAQRFLF